MFVHARSGDTNSRTTGGGGGGGGAVLASPPADCPPPLCRAFTAPHPTGTPSHQPRAPSRQTNRPSQASSTAHHPPPGSALELDEEPRRGLAQVVEGIVAEVLEELAHTHGGKLGLAAERGQVLVAQALQHLVDRHLAHLRLARARRLLRGGGRERRRPRRGGGGVPHRAAAQLRLTGADQGEVAGELLGEGVVAVRLAALDVDAVLGQRLEHAGAAHLATVGRCHHLGEGAPVLIDRRHGVDGVLGKLHEAVDLVAVAVLPRRDQLRREPLAHEPHPPLGDERRDLVVARLHRILERGASVDVNLPLEPRVALEQHLGHLGLRVHGGDVQQRALAVVAHRRQRELGRGELDHVSLLGADASLTLLELQEGKGVVLGPLVQRGAGGGREELGHEVRRLAVDHLGDAAGPEEVLPERAVHLDAGHHHVLAGLGVDGGLGDAVHLGLDALVRRVRQLYERGHLAVLEV
mmetsp:Transcript_13758/g.27207  ORF Transcript_13758/g.27207 Transcript_13758/m.27207 type:complete len:466 (-) Transcript_13758:830-2227(-)